jgi:hypothetical protein
MKRYEFLNEFYNRINQCYGKLKVCVFEIAQDVKFIHSFIGDMLDFSVLIKDPNKFIK